MILDDSAAICHYRTRWLRENPPTSLFAVSVIDAGVILSPFESQTDSHGGERLILLGRPGLHRKMGESHRFEMPLLRGTRVAAGRFRHGRSFTAFLNQFQGIAS